MMSMDPQIKQVVEILDKRIAHLQNMKRMFVEEFGPQGASAVAVATRPTPRANGNGNGNQTRKDQLTKFLTDNGPSKRAKIIAESGMPRGTIASLLSKDGFVRRSDGKWQVDENSAQENTH